MGEEAAPGQVKQLNPAGGPLAEHCQRVGALAAEIARKIAFPPEGARLVRQAALVHHFPLLLLDAGALARLLQDVLARSGTPAPEVAAAAPAFSEDLASVLLILHCRFQGPADPHLRRVAAIVQLSDLLDEQMQFLPYEDAAPEGPWAGLEQISEFTLFDRELVEQARRALTAGGGAQRGCGAELTVQARTARKIFSVLAFRPDCDLREMERLATSDPVLAGRLIQIANSALYSPARRIGSVRQALVYVGGEKSRKVMLAAALEPVFAGGMRAVWKHSLRAAQLSEALARATGIMDAEEALLMGLVHDIGRQQTGSAAANRESCGARLLGGGCPLTYVERLLLHCDHGERGAEVLKTWDFPEHLIEAVRYHHRPDASEAVHAAVLYLIEFWTGGEEDLPSLTRLGNALARTGVSGETLMSIAPRRGSLYELLGAA